MSADLSLVMAEIAAVLKRHDVAGVVCLAAPPAGELRYLLETTWSALRIDGANLVIEGVDACEGVERVRLLEQAAGLASTFQTVAAGVVQDMEQTMDMLAGHLPAHPENASRVKRIAGGEILVDEWTP